MLLIGFFMFLWGFVGFSLDFLELFVLKEFCKFALVNVLFLSILLECTFGDDVLKLKRQRDLVRKVVS